MVAMTFSLLCIAILPWTVVAPPFSAVVAPVVFTQDEAKAGSAKEADGSDDADKTARDQPSPPRQGDPEELFGPYVKNVGLLGRLEVVPAIRAMRDRKSEDEIANQVVPRLTGERNRLILEVKNLVETLGDVRYEKRVGAERELVAKGPLILPILESFPEQQDLEIKIRLERVLSALEAAGKEDIERRARIARGLAEALAFRSGTIEVDALLAALDFLDSHIGVRIAALRSTGVLLRNDELAARSGQKFMERVSSLTGGADIEERNAVTTAIGSMPIDASRSYLLDIFASTERSLSHRILAFVLLQRRSDMQGAPLEAALAALKDDEADFLRQIAACLASPIPAERTAPTLHLELEDGGKLEATHIVAMEGDNLYFEGPASIGAPILVPRPSIDAIVHATATPKKLTGPLLLLDSGTAVSFSELRLEGEDVAFKALGRDLRIPKQSLRGILPDASKGRILGGSRVHDQIRLLSGEERLVEGKLTALSPTEVTIEQDGKARNIEWKAIEALLFPLGGTGLAAGDIGDIGQFAQLDLLDGERLVGYLLFLDATTVRIADKRMGCIDIALQDVARMQLSNSGRALTGFTLVCDFSNLSVQEFDGEGRVVWKLEDLFDPYDAEITPVGTILITEHGDDAVREYDRSGKAVWAFTKLAKPMDADRLANGNTLITDPGNNRVIEVDKDGNIVWTFGIAEAKRKEYKPYDADRLPNGNTLIADNGDKRVIEVNSAGEVVWELKGIDVVVDADRLPNGNTLITRRQPNMVFEVNAQGSTVWKLEKLTMPGDADRLPDGTTMVAEDGGVKIYGRDGAVLRTLAADWAMEASGY